MPRIKLDRERTIKLTRRAAYKISLLKTLEAGGPGLGTYAGVCQAIFALQDPTEKPQLNSPEEVADHLGLERMDEAVAACVAAFDESEDFSRLAAKDRPVDAST